MSTEIATMRRSLAPTTYAEAFEFAQHLAKSSMVPAEYKGKPENILLAMQWGMEVGLAPLQAIQNIAIINGKPSVYGDALLAMVKGSPVCDDVIERFEGSGETLTAICEARRVGKAPVFARFGVGDAKLAHLWGKAGPWVQYPKRMLQMRARGFALRDAFPDVLRGVILAEEATDYPLDVGRPREPIDITPQADLDAFAARETGDDNLRITAEETATLGTQAFREFWKPLSAGQRDALRPDLAEYQRVAAEADEARVASEAREAAMPVMDEDPFGLAEPGIANSVGLPAVEPSDNLFVPLPPHPTAADLEYYARQLMALIGEEPLTAPRTAWIKSQNEAGIGYLKLKLVGRYDEVMAALNQKVEAV